MNVKVRFAPSPTGHLHLGNARVALLNYLFAKHYNGTFLLRIDDTDNERVKRPYIQAVYEDLQWLHIIHDETFHQYERLSHYETAKQKLLAAGRLYACYETTEELALMRTIQLSRKKPPIYDRSALKLTPEAKEKLEKEGHKPYYRFLLQDENIAWEEPIFGHLSMNPTRMSDPVVFREDGSSLYTFSSVVDDGETNITHVIRGADHITNTAIQIQIMQTLGFTPPNFIHVPLIVSNSQEPLSKRKNSLSIESIREAGYTSESVDIFLATLGASEILHQAGSLKAIIESFDFTVYGKSEITFNLHDLQNMAGRIMPHTPVDVIETWFLQKNKLFDKNVWPVVKNNVYTLNDVEMWVTVLSNPTAIDLQTIHSLFSRAQWKTLAIAIEKNIDLESAIVSVDPTIKNKQKFLAMRLIVTGKKSGPDMHSLLNYITPEFLIKRVQYIAQHD